MNSSGSLIGERDRPEAAPDRIREQLSKMNILVEEWGGKYQSQEISAKKGENIQPLDVLGGHQYWVEMKIEGEYTFHASLVAVDGQTAIHEAALRSPMNPHKIKLPRSAHLLSAGDIQLLQDLYADVK